MVIREISATDANSYYRLRIQSEQEFPEFVGFNAERELVAGELGIEELLGTYESEGTIVWGAFEDVRLAGVTALSRRLSPKYRHKAFLWGMYVIPEFREHGIARSLMQTAITWAKKQPEIVAISLQVTLSNIRGQAFYKRFGFTVFGTEKQSLLVDSKFHDVHYMELEIKDPANKG
ncbi:MAG TPA: GNAT family N-acetyltransferase [Gammaproteobacteria bacterium]